ncbi:MAG: HDIG domain-containing metalloprotein, partial [Bacteroidota bacterium]
VDAKPKMMAKRDTVSNQLDRVFEVYKRYQENLAVDSLAWATQDSLNIVDLKRTALLRLTQQQWNFLIASYHEREFADSLRRVQLADEPRLDEVLLQEAWSIGTQLLNVGILDIQLDSIYTDEISIRRDDESIVVRKNKANLFGLDEAFVFAQDRYTSMFADDPQRAKLGAAFFRAIFQHSLSFMRAETYREWRRKEERISPTRGMVPAASVIVNNGEIVTEEIKRRLDSLGREQQERSGNQLQWKVALGQFTLALATLLIFFLYLFVLRRRVFDNNKHILLIALLFIGIIGSFAIAIRYPWAGMYAVPVAVIPLMMTVMFDSRVALFGLWTLAFIGGHFLNYDFEYTFATIFAGTLGIFSVRDIKNRGQIFLSAAAVAIGYAVVLGASWLLYDVPIELWSNDFGRAMINAAQVIVVVPLLWVFERAFDITTDLTLLELSDTNRPLLKELSLRAPGTFNHTLQVANLAEAAADAIGANALLARVGALYHDVGKMIKPEYFVENQRAGGNPHDHLKPRMSALIIASHVKEGLEIGKNYNLPNRVLEFIPMHHGTSLIEYFYRKAQADNTDEQSDVLESEFRYPGPRPNSREAGILMLADSVEAASRSISEPTHKRLESMVEGIFKSRVNDGQLDETDLTFNDLYKIKETFLEMLLGIHHGRVKYPGQAEAEAAAELEAEEEVPVVEVRPPDIEGGGDGQAEQITPE